MLRYLKMSDAYLRDYADAEIAGARYDDITYYATKAAMPSARYDARLCARRRQPLMRYALMMRASAFADKIIDVISLTLRARALRKDDTPHVYYYAYDYYYYYAPLR